jgi:hypothetical protein
VQKVLYLIPYISDFQHARRKTLEPVTTRDAASDGVFVRSHPPSLEAQRHVVRRPLAATPKLVSIIAFGDQRMTRVFGNFN